MPALFPRLRAQAWLPALAALLVHLVLWNGTSAYDQYPALDRVTQSLGGVTATWFLLCCMLVWIGLVDMALGMMGGIVLIVCTRRIGNSRP